MKDKIYDDLQEDMFKLMEKYSDKLTPPEFGFMGIMHIAHMMFDTAPNEEVVIELVNEAMKQGKRCSDEICDEHKLYHCKNN